MSMLARSPLSWASIFRKVQILLLVFVLPVLSCRPTFAKNKPAQQTPKDVVAEVDTSIVRVDQAYSYQVEGELTPRSLSNSGTGFIVDAQGHIATANHVVDAGLIQDGVEKQLKQKNQSLVPGSFQMLRLHILVYAPNTESDAHGNSMNNLSSFYDAQVFAQDKPLDIAILQCESNLLNMRPMFIINGESIVKPRTLPTFQKEPPLKGSTIAATGFPAVQGQEQTAVLIPSLTTNTGTLANPVFVIQDRQFVYLADIHVNEGDSGGPVFNKSDGSIIGFVDAYLSAVEGGNSGLTIVVPIRHVLKLLPSQPDKIAAK